MNEKNVKGNKKVVKVAIDGPAAAGKTTAAKAVAKALGWRYVDTGATYRAAALRLTRRGASPDDPESVREGLEGIDVRLDGDRTYLDGEDVTGLIRTDEISEAASAFSASPIVREALLGMQRALANETDSVTEGRDVGTVVLPDADVKVFLTATPDERAARRWRELAAAGTPKSFAKTKAAMAKRDARDSEREACPLAAAESAAWINSTDMTKEEVAETIARMAREAAAAKAGKADGAIDAESVRALAYAVYVIDWEARIGAKRKARVLMEAAQARLEDDGEPFDGPADVKGAYEERLDEAGYQGELYVCYDEFLGAEYLDGDYVHELFEAGTQDDGFLAKLAAAYEADPLVAGS